MQFKINCSPHLKMDEITKKLFNRNFHSDIRFCVGNKIIYAHSLELMKRSVVFEKQLEDTMGEKKLIPITDCSYESLFEFIRFIYTDECKINDDNGMELLKLAIKYKIIILENRVINLLTSGEWTVQLFGHSVIENYEIARNFSKINFAFNFGKLLDTDEYLSLHQDAVNEALQFDQIEEGVTEVQIFNALAGWINNYCKQHEISISQGRQRFDDLIRKIRFPTMTSDEIRDCHKKYPGLLSDSDCTSIAKQVLFGSDGANNLWIAQRRSDFRHVYEWRKTNRDTPFVTTFSVSKVTILYGLWIGVDDQKKDIEIKITETNSKTLKTKSIVFRQSSSEHYIRLLISLGVSLELKPNFEYTINVTYLGITDKYITVVSRKENTNLDLKDPENSIQTIKASDNMLEMFFKSPPQ